MKTESDFPLELSPRDFAAVGVDRVAYIRLIRSGGGEAFSVHAADGTPLAVLPELETALAAVRGQDMEPLRVH